MFNKELSLQTEKSEWKANLTVMLVRANQKLVINLEFISFYLIQLSWFKIFQIN